MLRGDQRHHMLVICPVRGVVVHEHIRVPVAENQVEQLGVAGVGFNVVAVQVQVAGVASEAVFFGAVLVGAGMAVAV